MLKITELTLSLDHLNTLDASDDDDIVIIDFSREAKKYLLSHLWCSEVTDGWLAIYWEGILGVFLFKISSDYEEVDDYVWMVVGDLPSAYVDIESANSPNEVLKAYVGIMSDWVNGVLNNTSLEDCYPVEVPPTKEYAEMLNSRLDFLLKEIEED